MRRIPRYFAIVDENGNSHGRYTGSKPKQAACKAFSTIIKTKENRSEQINFTIRECTRGSRCKQYYYTGKRHELDVPNTITIKGRDGQEDKTITYKFLNRVMKNLDR